MKKQKIKILSLRKKTVSDLNKLGLAGGIAPHNSIMSMDVNYCSSGNLVSAVLLCMEAYTDICNC